VRRRSRSSSRSTSPQRPRRWPVPKDDRKCRARARARDDRIEAAKLDAALGGRHGLRQRTRSARSALRRLARPVGFKGEVSPKRHCVTAVRRRCERAVAPAGVEAAATSNPASAACASRRRRHVSRLGGRIKVRDGIAGRPHLKDGHAGIGVPLGANFLFFFFFTFFFPFPPFVFVVDEDEPGEAARMRKLRIGPARVIAATVSRATTRTGSSGPRRSRRTTCNIRRVKEPRRAASRRQRHSMRPPGRLL